MEFNNNKAIYLQIAEFICEGVLLERWKTEEKIPSVREMAMQLEVNPNTVMRTYELLQQKNIIYNKRGVGFFLPEDAVAQVNNYRKAIFMDEELPNVFRNLYLLNISFDELENKYQSFVDENFKD